jgi:hypothetical protein
MMLNSSNGVLQYHSDERKVKLATGTMVVSFMNLRSKQRSQKSHDMQHGFTIHPLMKERSS